MPLPSNPTNNQTASLNGVTYSYNSAKDAWRRIDAVYTVGSSGISSGNLSLGNLTVTGNSVLGNTFVGNLFYANGSVFVSGSGSGNAAISIGDSPPASPVSGSLWWDSASASLFFYYADVDSSQWVNAIGAGSGGGIGLTNRITANVTTSNIANAVTANTAITGFKGYNLYKISVSHPAWVRLYTSAAARTLDSSRSQGADPAADSGVVAEVITNTVSQTVILSPVVVGFNDESPATTAIPVAITNLSGGANAVTVSVTILQTEA